MAKSNFLRSFEVHT